MILLDTVRNLDSFDEGSTIYASEPWKENSKVIVAPETEAGDLPKYAGGLGLKYFLEVAIAREFLDGWVAGLEGVPTTSEKCARLIKYAIDDA